MAEIVDLTGDDRTIILGALLWMVDRLNSEQGGSSARAIPDACYVAGKVSRWLLRIVKNGKPDDGATTVSSAGSTSGRA